MMKKVLKFIQQYDLIKRGDHVVVGVSGGADSVCLLFVLKEISTIMDFSISAVHINHHLRKEEADRDEAFTKKICEQLIVPYEVYHYDVGSLSKTWKISIEETGRVIRREAFEQHSRKYSELKDRIDDTSHDKNQEKHHDKKTSKVKIALAHHKNDAAETFLYHLARGTDITGLCAMRPVRGQYIRPLLCMNRKEIEHYLRERNIEYVTDSTNEEDIYTRNKIRHHAIPYLEEEINAKAVTHIAKTAESLCEVNDFLQVLYQEKFIQYAKVRNDGIFLQDSLWKEKPLVVKGVIRLVLERLAGSLKNIGRTHILSVQKLFEHSVGKVVSLPYAIKAEREYYGVAVLKYTEKKEDVLCVDNNKKAEQEVPLLIPGETLFENYRVRTSFEEETLQEIPEKTYTKWFDYDKIKGILVLRHRKKGDYLVINARGGKKKLKDYLINEKIPQKERDKIPLICCDDHVAWVCGHRISELYKVDASSRCILKIQISAIHRE